jgi:hypothetical protein
LIGWDLIAGDRLIGFWDKLEKSVDLPSNFDKGICESAACSGREGR